MGINYTPSMEGYSGQTPFKFWCQSVLPSEYDDSMSYYELLNKVVTILNTAINDVDNAEKNIDALLNAYNELQGYVNEYFDNLDVQQEINNKLDSMAISGELSPLLGPYVTAQLPSVVHDEMPEVVASQIDGAVDRVIDDVVASQIATPAAEAADAWLDENLSSVTETTVIDASLTLANAAAQSKAAGDGININKSMLSNIVTSDDADFSGNTINQGISPSSKKWTGTSAGYVSYILLLPESKGSVTVTANNDANSVIGFLTNNSHTYNTQASLVNNTLHTITAGNSEEIYTPQNAKFLYVLYSYTQNDVTTNYMPNTLKYNYVDKSIRTAYDKLLEWTRFKNNIILSDYQIGIRISASNSQYVSAGTHIAAFIPIKDTNRITISANETTKTVYGLLSDDISEIVSQNYANYADNYGLHNLANNTSINIDNLSGVKTLYVYCYNTSNPTPNYTPSSVILWQNINDKDIPLDLHEIPINNGVLNVIKRCRQLCDISWKPVANLPRLMLNMCDTSLGGSGEEYVGSFNSGVTYKGIPYGRARGSNISAYGYTYFWVGIDIGLETFITAVRSPNSIIYAEKGNNTAVLDDHYTMPYAVVCSALTCYALNVDYHATDQIANISGLNRIGKINDNGTLLDDSNFQLGDVLNLAAYHTAIITDIIRDKNGDVQYIELCDASTSGCADWDEADGELGGICRRKGWTLSDIYNTAKWGNYVLYRYANIASVPYSPSPFVNVGDEFDMQRVYNLPCVPYNGNKFVYKTGYIPNNKIKILLNTVMYDKLVVLKDGTPITGSPFTISNSDEYVEISEISTGDYKAFMCSMSGSSIVNSSYPCEWSIQ